MLILAFEVIVQTPNYTFEIGIYFHVWLIVQKGGVTVTCVICMDVCLRYYTLLYRRRDGATILFIFLASFFM